MIRILKEFKKLMQITTKKEKEYMRSLLLCHHHHLINRATFRFITQIYYVNVGMAYININMYKLIIDQGFKILIVAGIRE